MNLSKKKTESRRRQRKSKSANGTEGIQQIQKVSSRLSSDSSPYFDGDTRDDMFELELAPGSLGRPTGTTMRELLAEESSKEVESKKRSPSVIARLMGLEGLASPWHVDRQQKMSSGSYEKKNLSLNNQRNGQLYDGLSNRRSLVEQHEFEDVYEDLEASHVINLRCSSRWSTSSRLTESQMARIQQKFIDVKQCLFANGKLRDSKALDDALEMLDWTDEMWIKFLREPDSSFLEHLHDPYADPGSSSCSNTAALNPSNSAKYEGNCKAWTSERINSLKHDITSHLKRKDGLLLESHYQNRAQSSHKSSKIHLEEKNEEKILSTRITIRKPRKMHNTGISGSLPDHPHGVGYSKKTKEYPSVGGAETESWRRQDFFESVGFSMPISDEAREIAKKVSRMMRDGYDQIFYARDWSSHEAIESDSDIELDVLNLSSRKYGNRILRRYQSRSLDESTINREANQRLSERWKMSQRYQDLEMVGNGCTLGEMLRLPDEETMPKPLNAKTSLGRASHRLDGNNSIGIHYGPLGISSRDGWKDEKNRTSSRSRSLHRSSTHHDELAEDKYLFCSDSMYLGRSKVVKRHLSHKEYFSSNDLKPKREKPLPYQHIFTSATDSLSEIKMEANIKDFSDELPIFQLAAKDETGSKSLSLKSSESLSKESSLVADDVQSDSDDQECSNIQELQKGLQERGSPSLRSLRGELNPSESSNGAYDPSPVSILEGPVTEDTPSIPESFERVSADIHDFQMKLERFMLKSGISVDASDLIPIEEEEVPQLPPIISGGNHTSETEHWETCYARDVLLNFVLDDSCFDLLETTWYSPECPLDPEVFDDLEKIYSDQTTGLRSERMLLFDRINQTLIDIFQDHVDLAPWKLPEFVDFITKLQKDGIRVAMEKLISQQAQGHVDDAIPQRSIYREVMHWLHYICKGETKVIGKEIEEQLIDDIITEIICK